MPRFHLLTGFLTGLLIFVVLATGPARAQSLGPLSPGQPPVVEPVLTGLDHPWAVDFLPDGGVLVTERPGRLLLLDNGQVTVVSGLPKIAAGGQGGLLDVLVPRDFARSREIFLTYSKQQGSGRGTALYRARLAPAGDSLLDGRILFEMARDKAGSNSSGVHFGSRLVEAQDGTLWMTLGERGQGAAAQDLSRHNGKVVRLTRDGKVPADNPFIGQSGVRPEIYSLGHRNPQGAALDGQGRLWVIEHGARGGDEVNLVAPGRNYGWPVIAFGTHYDGARIGEGVARTGMEQPVFYWDPSIAPSGMTFYDGALFPHWQGDAFTGSLKFDYISRLSGSPLREVERLRRPETARVRDVVTGPDGALWFLSEDRGALYRLVPG